jgi:integrase/recombinase XerD
MAATQARPDPTTRAGWAVNGPTDDLTRAANGFLDDLAVRGRQTYTLKSYAIGLAHFVGWMHDTHPDNVDITDGMIGAYLCDFEHGRGNRRAATTVRHRLSVVTSFREHLAQNTPLPSTSANAHRMSGRDLPPRERRQTLRRTPPRTIPRAVDAETATGLIGAASSWRNKALLTLMWRTGQRIGDWHPTHGRHGPLGLSIGDIDPKAQTIKVVLKGARDQRIVPVTDDFWPLWDHYRELERRTAATDAAWVA